ncbi:MAG: hypothetical protein ACXVPU_01275 [Bacteroidia bacterium]
MDYSRFLLQRFVGKGGMLGSMASYYSKDSKKSAKFLFELKEQLKKNKKFMVAEWGEKLIQELEQFN